MTAIVQDGAKKATPGLVLAVERSARRKAPPGRELPAMARRAVRSERFVRRPLRRVAVEEAGGRAVRRLSAGGDLKRREASYRGERCRTAESVRAADPAPKIFDDARPCAAGGFSRNRDGAVSADPAGGGRTRAPGVSATRRAAMNLAACRQGACANERTEQGRKS